MPDVRIGSFLQVMESSRADCPSLVGESHLQTAHEDLLRLREGRAQTAVALGLATALGPGCRCPKGPSLALAFGKASLVLSCPHAGIPAQPLVEAHLLCPQAL